MDTTGETRSLLNALVKVDGSLKRGRVDFETAMQKMGFSSVFDIVRLPKPAFTRKLAKFSDANADLAYDNAMSYAALIARLYREYQTSSGRFQSLAERTGVRALTPSGPTFQNLFNEKWDEFCKVGALAAVDSPVAYLSALRVFIQQLEATSGDAKRILLDERRPDLKGLLITRESTLTPRPMLEIVNGVLSSQLRAYLEGNQADKSKSIHQVLTERRYPFELPYNFYHQQCQLGLSEKKPWLGELNYRASLLLPIVQAGKNDYGKVQQPVVQAQRWLTGLSPQQQKLLTEAFPYSDFYLDRNDLTDLTNGWQGPGSCQLRPHSPMKAGYLLPLAQVDIGTANPTAHELLAAEPGSNSVPMTFQEAGPTVTLALSADEVADPVPLKLSSGAPTNINKYFLNSLHNNSAATICTRLVAEAALPGPVEGGSRVSFDLHLVTGEVGSPIKLIKRRFTLTLDEHYQPTEAEKNHFAQVYGVGISDAAPTFLTDLNEFMKCTGLHAEQVEMLLSRRTHAVRLSPNCPSKNRQSAEGVVPFPHANHFGACYVNGTGSGLYDSVVPATADSIVRDKFDNAMDLVQVELGDSKHWRICKSSLNRFDRLQRMIRLQRWTGIPFARLDTLIISAIRAEGEENLGMDINENTLRALGVYRYLNHHHGIDALEFAALMHDVSPFATGKSEVPLFDQVFNRVKLFDTPLVLDQTALDFDGTDAVNQKTILQLCAGLGLQPTDDSFQLIARQTKLCIVAPKRDLATVSSLFRQARIARLFGCSVAELLTLANLLGGQAYKTAMATGRLSPRTTSEVPDILDVLMQLDWAFEWLKDSQQSVAQLQERLGPDIPLLQLETSQDKPPMNVAEPEPVTDAARARLFKLHKDAGQSVVTEEQVTALDLPASDGDGNPLNWMVLLTEQALIDDKGLMPGLDRDLELTDEALAWLGSDLDELLLPLKLSDPVKQTSKEKLISLLLDVQDKQTQLLEALFQETAKLPSDCAVAVVHWAHSSVYGILGDALSFTENDSLLIENFQRVSRHAEIVLQLRLSNRALRLFVINPTWLGNYPNVNSEPALSDLYLLERFSHWLHGQTRSEDALLNYFSLANYPAPKLKNKALRKAAADTANGALSRLLEWPEKEIQALTDTLQHKRARSMAEVDWIRRCQASCQASGLSARSLLQATALNDQSVLNALKTVGEAVMAASTGSASSPVIV
ncbi:Tc toxin subunit A [Pseudomonas sp. P1.8]|uniref:Tc toxin subunit A n=1 Tax=Pseudomonas sp. P1.8 TaxID=1699310 RepID=UPI00069EB2B2|nr:Tc toxin subunit A [Pseudomonas sp. P1.8]